MHELFILCININYKVLGVGKPKMKQIESIKYFVYWFLTSVTVHYKNY